MPPAIGWWCVVSRRSPVGSQPGWCAPRRTSPACRLWGCRRHVCPRQRLCRLRRSPPRHHRLLALRNQLPRRSRAMRLLRMSPQRPLRPPSAPTPIPETAYAYPRAAVIWPYDETAPWIAPLHSLPHRKRPRGIGNVVFSSSWRAYFSAAFAAVPIVALHPSTRQALSLRSQRVLRLQAFRGTTTVLVAQTATGLLRSIDDGNTFVRIDLGLPRSGLGKLRLVDWPFSAAICRVCMLWLESLARNGSIAATTTARRGGSPAGYRHHKPKTACCGHWPWRRRTSQRVCDWDRTFGVRPMAGEPGPTPGLYHKRLWAEKLLVAIDSQDLNTLFASTGEGFGAAKTAANTGIELATCRRWPNWAAIASANHRSGLMFAGGRGLVFSSYDGGESWKATALPAAEGLVRVLLVDVRVGETVFAVDESSRSFVPTTQAALAVRRFRIRPADSRPGTEPCRR